MSCFVMWETCTKRCLQDVKKKKNSGRENRWFYKGRVGGPLQLKQLETNKNLVFMCVLMFVLISITVGKLILTNFLRFLWVFKLLTQIDLAVSSHTDMKHKMRNLPDVQWLSCVQPSEK